MVTVTNAADRHRVQPGEGHDGVVQVQAEGHIGTGTLLWGGRAVLTAAHVVEGRDAPVIRAETPRGEVSLAASRVVVHPRYDPLNANHDLALVWLEKTAPWPMDRVTLHRDAGELGQVMSLLGYGLAGDGVGGYEQDDGALIKRMAENRFDALVEAIEPTGIGWDPEPGTQLIVDFDDGSVTHDALGRLIGRHDLGRGATEGLIAPGDSGGPAFIDDALAGVATYTARLSNGDVSPDNNDAADSSFGEVAAFQRVSHYQQWIDRTLRKEDPLAPAAPEEVEVAPLEGDVGTLSLYFLLEFHGERTHPEQWLSVDYATRDGTAVAGEDYLAVADTVILYPGETRAAIPVEVIGDTVPEPDETLYLDVFNPVGGSFGEGVLELTAVRTLVDDDGWIA